MIRSSRLKGWLKKQRSRSLVLISVASTFVVSTALADQVTYTYDPLGRLDTVTYSDGTVVDYDYDANGNRTVLDVNVIAPAFSINDVSVSEGGLLSFTVTKTGEAVLTHAVNYASAIGTASSSDFTATSGILSFASGETSKTLTVATVEDSIYEDSETVIVNLSVPTNGATISDSQGVGTINDDDTAPAFSINNISAAEGNTLSFTITKSGATSKSHNISYATANGTASAGSDYTSQSGMWTFTAAETSQTVTITGIEDSTYEPSETFYVNISVATNGATISDSQGVGTITNDDAAPAFSINNVSVSEGGSLSFTATKTGSTSQTHAVSYATANGSAGSGDYTTKSGTLSFSSGQSSQTVTVVTTEDSIYEAAETVNLNLSAATNGATISDSLGVGTINDDDTAPAFSINNVSVSEGGSLSYTVTKTGSTSQTHAVSYATANGSAGSGDYTTKSGSLSFSSGQTSQTVTVVTTEDSIYEASETVNLNLSAATNGATISDSQGVGTITNDDTAPAFSINNVSVSEGGSLSFTVTKSGSTSQTHAVSYATANGSAGSGDYTTKTGSLSFSSGQTSQTVTVVTTEDSIYEASETVNLNLSAATNGATISDSQGVGTITNDDAAPAFSINNVTAEEGNNLTFTISKSGLTANSHNISYATANGTASAGSDYTSKSGTLTFTAAQSSKTVTITGIEDGTVESNETFYVNLSSATGGATISDSQGVGTITNDDAPNSPPVAVNDSINNVPLNDDRNKYVLTNDSDPDGDSLTITGVTQPWNAIATVIGTRINVIGTSTGTGTCTYTISDGNGGTDTATLTVTVTGGGGGGGFPW